ncbi:chemokine XC receptor 1-like [Mugil cephalus]|uniref:chemokine XC receptor 1-like n=1 Tax=Mugil cephalus TaxID=48193 RepID=UPI001FB6C016|nr:chemokine XC receptor 1-like [Mugil cephalus]
MANVSTVTDDGDNGTDQTVYLCDYSDFSTVSGAFFILIFIISATANCVLLCVVFLYENLKNVTNMFVLNLACSDLVFTVTLPFWGVYHLHHWVFGDFLCKFITAAYFLSLYSSVILLTAMTVDRFVAVVLHNYPSNRVTRKRCLIGACVGAWVISVGASLSDGISTQVEYWDDIYLCEAHSDGSDTDVAYYLQASLLFFLPFAIIIVCYSSILKTVVQASNRKRYRTVVVVLCIVAVFFICWGPYSFLLLIKRLYKPNDCEAKERLDVAYQICRLFAFSHCFMNPLLYMLSGKMRRHLLHLLHLKRKWGTHAERSTGHSTGFQDVLYTAQTSAVTFTQKSNRGSQLK